MNYSVVRIITALALFLAVLELPYEYYIFLRVFVCGVSLYGVVLASEQKKQVWFWIMAGVAVLFNPIVPVYMEKEVWVVFDILAGGIFLVSVWGFKKS